MIHWLCSLFRRRCERETLIYHGEHPTGPHLIGARIELAGRLGTVVGYTLLTVTVEWDA